MSKSRQALTKENWIFLGNVGLSSTTIWSHFALNAEPDWPSAPADPSDFLRCYWLLKLAPEWRTRLDEIGKRYKEWLPLIEAWEELENMLEVAWPESCSSGDYCDEPPATAMYRRMKELR